MRTTRLALGVLILLLAVPATASETVSGKNWRKVLKHVVPGKAQQRWQAVAWHATLWDAVVEAHKEKKPILLWAMNGHALACT